MALLSHYGVFEVLVLFGGISFEGSFRGAQILRAVSNLHFEYVSRSMQIFASLFHLVTGVAPFDGADFHCDAAVLGSEPNHAKSISRSRRDTPRASKKAGMREVAS